MPSKYQMLFQEQADLATERVSLGKEASAILNVAKGDRKAEQTARFDAIETRINAIDERGAAIKGELAEVEKVREWERNAPPAVAPISNIHDRSLDMPWGLAYKGTKVAAAAAFGEQLQAISRARVGHALDPRLAQYMAVAQGAGENDPGDGGFLVGKDSISEIILTLTAGEVLSRVRRLPPLSPNSNGITINVIDESSRATGSRFGAVQGYWVDEGTAPTASRPKFHKIKLELKKVAALGYATDELLADARMLGLVMTQAFGEELRFLVEDAIIQGTGAGQPLGIVAHASTVSVAKETGQAASTIVYENILKMWARMYGRSRGNAVWFINQDTEPQLNAMSLAVGTGGIPVYLPPGGLSDSPFARLMGRPIIPIEYCPTLGTVGDIILADMSQYVFIEKDGVQQASSMHVAFTTDEMAFRATYRVDGQSSWRTTKTPFKGSALGPFVTLATRA